MRIDHSSPRDDSAENIRYFHDYSLSPRSFTSMFIYTSHGYLPNPEVNYPPPSIEPDGSKRRDSLDMETSPHCASEGIERNYQFVGRLIGRAIFDGIPLGVSLNPLMYCVIMVDYF